jgi:predicted Abi (CAAX) family protease
MVFVIPVLITTQEKMSIGMIDGDNWKNWQTNTMVAMGTIMIVSLQPALEKIVISRHTFLKKNWV